MTDESCFLFLSRQSECLKNIMKDLAYYAAAFESYLETPLQNPVNTTAVLKPVQDTIQSLRKVCMSVMCGRGKNRVMI